MAQLGLSSKQLSTMHPAIWGILGKPRAPFIHKNVTKEHNSTQSSHIRIPKMQQPHKPVAFLFLGSLSLFLCTLLKRVLLFALTLQIQSGKCCALGEFLIKLWSMCITSTTLAVHAYIADHNLVRNSPSARSHEPCVIVSFDFNLEPSRKKQRG